MLANGFRRTVCGSDRFIASTLAISIRNFSKDKAGTSVKPKCNLVIDGQLFKCVKMIQGKRGKGGGFVKATLKNLITGSTSEKTFTSDEMVEHADLERKGASYSWADNDNYMFMNTDTFEEIAIPKKVIDNVKLLFPGLEVKLLFYGDTVIGVELPLILNYVVVGRTTDGSHNYQPAMLEGCDAVVLVPDFINPGTSIRVNTSDGTYVGRTVEA